MQKPNVVLIYADQMRFDALSCNGNKISSTPRMDSLAKEGANFNKAYTSYPLCCPFRASLMTGLYAHNNGMYSNHYPLDTDLPHYLPKLMKENGYRTAWVGKWHLCGGQRFKRVPKEYWFGFDEFIGYNHGHHYLDSVYYRDEQETPFKSEKYAPLYQTDQLIDFIDRFHQDNQPFMGILCYGLPHPPVDSQPDEYKYMYDPDKIDVPDTVPKNAVTKAKQYLAKYYGMVKYVDEQIGRVVDYLKEKNIFDNTVFIVISDHGDMAGEYNMFEKTIFYDASAHVPLIVTYPNKIKSDTVIEQIVDCSINTTATILDFCGIEIPDTMDGESMKTLLTTGEDSSLRDYVYYEIIKISEDVCEQINVLDRKLYGERGIRTSDYLYVEKENIPYVLFDTINDKAEMANLVNSCTSYNRVKELKHKLAEIMKSNGDSWHKVRDKPMPNYKPTDNAKADYDNAYNNAIYEV